MSIVKGVSTGQVFHQTNNYKEYTETKFYKAFNTNVKSIGTDAIAYSDGESITSFDIGDCITVFAIEKNEKNKIEAIIGFHIGNGATVEDLKGDEYFDAFINGNTIDSEESEYSEGSDEAQQAPKSYELFIVGGDSNTTKGSNCLLKIILKAVEEFFPTGSFTIDVSLVNPNGGTHYKFVSANLQMDGTLSICRHNNRHG